MNKPTDQEREAFEANLLSTIPHARLHRRDALPKDDPLYDWYVDERVSAMWQGWQARAQLQPAGVAVPEGLHAILYRNNWDGEGETYYVIARKEKDGRWFVEETEEELLQYEGDAVLQAWPLTDDAAPHPVSGEQKPDELHRLDKQCRDDVARAMGMTPVGDGYPWSGLLAGIKIMAAPPAAQVVAGEVLAEWIEHGPSKPCPFTHPYSSKVDIRLRDGTEKLGELACNVTWFWYAHEHRDYHVVAYRPAAYRAQQGEQKEQRE